MRKPKIKVEPHPQNPNFPKEWNAPKSICVCGRTGDGPNSQHEATDLGTPGHGGTADGTCPKFRWSEWTPDYRAALNYLRGLQQAKMDFPRPMGAK